MSKLESLSVFFPAYNEELNIAPTIRKSLSVLDGLKLSDYEVLIINDGSTDTTADVSHQLMKECAKVRLIDHDRNRGYGGALKTGFENASFPWVAFADSDGQFDFAEIDKFLPYIDSADLILGYRLNRADPLIRSLTTWGWKNLARILVGLEAKDYSCGFKMIKKEVYEAVSPLVGEEKVTQIELLTKAKKQGFRFKEVGVNHYPRVYGQQTGADLKVVAKSFVDLMNLRGQLNKSPR
ncbi:MAG: glycosyltransferase family 2 protein [Candidatus Daviesbacteria bacterium]|nr:glycosyltransferase family 2 protein [Candidatus Daviesbacteria bacterium]